jgi:hypothetical protein
MPSERPIKEPVYGPSPEEVKEAQARAERARLIERELKNNIIRLNAPASTLNPKPSSSVVIRPGTSFFGILSGVETSLTAPLAGVKTPGSRIPIENLQRAVTILNSIKSDESDEDASFLAGQAALAMDGEPLQVEVNIPNVTSTEKVRQAQRLVQMTDDIHKENALIKERWILESDLVEIRKKKEADPKNKGQYEDEEAIKKQQIANVKSQIDVLEVKKKDFIVSFKEEDDKRAKGKK